MEEGIVSSLGDDDFLHFNCFHWSSGICWVGALAPDEMTEKKSHKENMVKISSAVGWLCCHTVYEFSRWEKLQSSRSFSPPPAVSCVQPSPAGPFFCLVLVAPSLICRETGTLCQCSSRFYSPLSPADIQSTNYHCEQQEAN